MGGRGMEKECSELKNIEKLVSRGISTWHSRVGTKFHLKMTLLNFRIKLTQKGYFPTKWTENCHRILHIQINLDSKFQLQQTILIFGTNFQKSTLSVENRKKEHHYWILHIRINPNTIFQVNLAIAIFLYQICPKRVAIFSYLKQIKLTPPLSFAYSN